MFNEEKEHEARILFHMYGGNFFEMERDGVYKKYKSFEVPKDVEAKWLQEMCNDIKGRINDSIGFERFSLIDRYVSKLDLKSSIHFLVDYLNNSNDDTFTKILIGEILIRYINQSKYSDSITIDIIEEVAKCIEDLKEKLLHSEITIDESYKKLYYLKDMLSNDKIIARIKALK